MAEETGVFEDIPERVELDTPAEGIERVPIIGQPLSAIDQAIISFLKQTPLKNSPRLKGIDIDPLIEDPITRREIMKAEIQVEQLNRTTTLTEALGATVEALGLTRITTFDIGSTVEQFVKTPSEDVETLRRQIKEIEGRASGMTDSASQAELGNPTNVLRNLDIMDKEITKTEAAIKFLIIQSAELKANPEEVNFIEEELLSAKTTIFEAKQRAAEGALITPSDAQLYFKLQELKG